MKNYNVRLFRELEFQYGRWEPRWDNGRVVYTSTENDAEIKMVLPGGIQEGLKYPSGTEVWVCNDAIHLPPMMDPAMEEGVAFREIQI